MKSARMKVQDGMLIGIVKICENSARLSTYLPTTSIVGDH